MAANLSGISGYSFARTVQLQSQRDEASKEARGEGTYADAAEVDDQSAMHEGSLVRRQQQLLESAADLTRNVRSALSRRDIEKKSGDTAAGDFERVLEEDAVPKVYQLLKIIDVQHDNLPELLAQARALFPDESDLYLVLMELLRQKNLSEAQRKRLRALLKDLEEKADPKKLKAGVNCALKARLFGATLAMKAAILRQTYRRFLENDQEGTEIYKDWIATYGYKKRYSVLSFIEESLTIDIQSEDPSCSAMEFGLLLGRMVYLRLLRSADQAFVKKLLKKHPKHCKEEAAEDDTQDGERNSEDSEEKDWLVLMLGLIDAEFSLDAIFFDVFGADFFSISPQQHAILLNGIYAAFKQLPRELFADDAIVEETLEAFQHLLDTAYEKETQAQYIERTRAFLCQQGDT